VILDDQPHYFFAGEALGLASEEDFNVVAPSAFGLAAGLAEAAGDAAGLALASGEAEGATEGAVAGFDDGGGAEAGAPSLTTELVPNPGSEKSSARNIKMTAE
jgi:hypothetical protein